MEIVNKKISINDIESIFLTICKNRYVQFKLKVKNSPAFFTSLKMQIDNTKIFETISLITPIDKINDCFYIFLNVPYYIDYLKIQDDNKIYYENDKSFILHDDIVNIVNYGIAKGKVIKSWR